MSEWILGEPQFTGWYIVAVESNDHGWYVVQLWFNPHSIDRWYTGGGYVSGRSEPYPWSKRVRGYMKLPEPPKWPMQ